MDIEQKEVIRQASFKRHYCCRKCGNAGLEVVDGARVGGMPGLNYKFCNGCGQSEPITKRRRKRRAL